MPLKLTPPREGRSRFYRVRGTYFGIRVDRSAETSDKRTAQAFLKRIQGAIEAGQFAAPAKLSFAKVTTGYLQAGGDPRFFEPILNELGTLAAAEITQTMLDNAAAKIYPDAAPATRNRQVYTPVIAALNHAGIDTKFNRPKGANGTPRSVFLSLEQFERLAKAATTERLEFGALVTLLCFTGLRLGEALRIKWADLRLDDRMAFCGRTKNGEPRAVHLPPRVVTAIQALPKGKDKIFPFTQGGKLYALATKVYMAAGVDDAGAPFHILRHSYGAWMTRLGADLVSTGAWRDQAAARGYQHFNVTEEAKKADDLPGAKSA